MHADVVVDDELEAGQAHAVVRQLREVEGQLRVADVHHQLDVDLGHHAALHFGHLGFEQAVVDEAGVALGAAHGHERAVLQQVGGVAAADHGWNAELARNDGRVAGAPAAVGDDGGGALHHRFPVGVGHVGDEHVAGLDLVHFADVVHEPHGAGTDLLPDGTAFGEHRPLAQQLVALLGLALLLALHGFRARLQDVELAVGAVLAPLDVHRAAIVFFDHERVPGELLDVRVAQRIAVALLGLDVGGLHQLAGGLFLLGRGELHLDQLGAQVAADHGLLAGAQRGLVNVELVGVHGALHHRFTEAVARGDEHHVLEARLGVDGEHHAGRAKVRADHALHARRERHHVVREALVHAVADGAVVVEGSKDFLHLVQHVVDADHVQEGFLLAREGGVGQVFGRGRGAHGERGRGVAFAQLRERLGNGFLQVGRKGLGLDHRADLGAGHGQRPHVFGVQGGEPLADLVGQAVVGQELAERMRRGREARGHPHALRQLRDHFAEAGVLAADRLDVGHPQVFKRYDQGGRVEKCRHGKAPEVETGAACRRRGTIVVVALGAGAVCMERIGGGKADSR